MVVLVVSRRRAAASRPSASIRFCNVQSQAHGAQFAVRVANHVLVDQCIYSSCTASRSREKKSSASTLSSSSASPPRLPVLVGRREPALAGVATSTAATSLVPRRGARGGSSSLADTGARAEGGLPRPVASTVSTTSTTSSSAGGAGAGPGAAAAAATEAGASAAKAHSRDAPHASAVQAADRAPPPAMPDTARGRTTGCEGGCEGGCSGGGSWTTGVRGRRRRGAMSTRAAKSAEGSAGSSAGEAVAAMGCGEAPDPRPAAGGAGDAAAWPGGGEGERDLPFRTGGCSAPSLLPWGPGGVRLEPATSTLLAATLRSGRSLWWWCSATRPRLRSPGTPAARGGRRLECGWCPP